MLLTNPRSSTTVVSLDSQLNANPLICPSNKHVKNGVVLQDLYIIVWYVHHIVWSCMVLYGLVIGHITFSSHHNCFRTQDLKNPLLFNHFYILLTNTRRCKAGMSSFSLRKDVKKCSKGYDILPNWRGGVTPNQKIEAEKNTFFARDHMGPF